MNPLAFTMPATKGSTADRMAFSQRMRLFSSLVRTANPPGRSRIETMAWRGGPRPFPTSESRAGAPAFRPGQPVRPSLTGEASEATHRASLQGGSVATYDLAIIGAGPGGYVAAIPAGQLGLKVVVIERDERLGGTCLLRGCIPTKCLLHRASVLEEAKAGAEIGVHTENVRVEMAGVNKYKDKVVAKNAKGVEFLFRKNKVERLHGH